MGHFYHHILSTAFAAFSAILAQAGSSPSNHPVYLALDGVPGSTANFEVIGTSLVSAQQVHRVLHNVLVHLLRFYFSYF
jgi:hypothetical protein